MEEAFGSPGSLKEMARIIHSFLKSKFPSMTESEREDIEQDVKLKLWKMKAGGKKINNMKSYVWKAVYTTALDSLEKRWVQLVPEDALTGEDIESVFAAGIPSPEDILEKGETSRALRRAVERLSRRRRTVMELHLLGMDIPESAAFLDWSEPTVRHLLYRGLDDLKKKMERTGRSKGGP